MVLSVSEFNAMARVTPTGLADDRLRAERAAHARVYPVGPAGIPIPPADAIYRHRADKDLIVRIGKAAGKAHLERTPAPAERDRAAAAIDAALAARFPPADVEVLVRHGFATARASILVTLDRPGNYQQREYIQLPAGRAMTDAAGTMRIQGGNGTAAELPDEAQPYFAGVIEARATAKQLAVAFVWAGEWHDATGRWPRWCEIEEGLPPIGAWLAEQRSAM